MTSSDAGRFSQNLCACKKLRYNERNCKSGRHNRQHTFMHHKSRHKTTSTNIPYTGLKVKGRNKGKTKLPSPCRQNQMICAINLRQDATRHEFTKMKPPFLPFDELDLCNDYMLKDLNTLIVFVLIFLVTVFSTKLIRILIC